MKPITKRLRLVAPLLLSVLMASCGGGGSDSVVAPASCSVADTQAWLAGYMDDWYFWYKISPRPNPASYPSVGSYFDALLYTGTDPAFPADRWSFTESTQTFNSFFGDGQTLGYGISVAGLEVTNQPTQPLYVRYVEPRSPAASAGVVRGDQVIAMNGRNAADLIAANDYSALSAAQAGDTLTLVLRSAGIDRVVIVNASIFDLSPVPNSAIVITPQGRKMGYVAIKDMINQVQVPLETAFAQFKAQGVNEIVLDLRYNGGGLVSVGRIVASYVAGLRGNGQVYASLLYNDKKAAQYNQSFWFDSSFASAAGVPRVFVLTGPRTCSASEQVINGLNGIGVTVVTIGDTSCGKPVGFLPTSDGCGTTYSSVNFESVNQVNQGRYFDGFGATCAVAEDFTAAQGGPADPLLGAAASYADNGSCPAALRAAQRLLTREAHALRKPEPGERQGMIGR